jgi:3-oxoacyl-[acyl-carrier protein] reductase
MLPGVDLGLRGRAYLLAGVPTAPTEATARALVTAGARVVLSGPAGTDLGSLAAALGGPARAVAMAADLDDPAAVADLVDRAWAAYGRLDGAMIDVRPAGGSGVDRVARAFDAAVRTMWATVARTGAGGSVVLALAPPVPPTTGTTGLTGNTGASGATGASGTTALVRTWADRLQPGGVRVNALQPAAPAAAADSAADAAVVPLRPRQPTVTFAQLAAYVLSPAAAAVTGSLLSV